MNYLWGWRWWRWWRCKTGFWKNFFFFFAKILKKVLEGMNSHLHHPTISTPLHPWRKIEKPPAPGRCRKMRWTLNSPFPFGKHKGKSLRFLLDNELNYLCWLKRQSWFKGPFRTLLENEGPLCGLCGDHPQGMYGGEDIYIKCPGCGNGS